MRITIDTDIQAIIVPDSYYGQVDKLNEIIEAAGGRKLIYSEYIKMCFEKAYATQIISISDLPRVRGTKGRRRSAGQTAETMPVGKEDCP